MMRILLNGTAYVVAVFAAGFLLGVLRTLGPETFFLTGFLGRSFLVTGLLFFFFGNKFV